jgi:hypothetical protein
MAGDEEMKPFGKPGLSVGLILSLAGCVISSCGISPANIATTVSGATESFTPIRSPGRKETLAATPSATMTPEPAWKMMGLAGLGVRILMIAPSNPPTLYAVTHGYTRRNVEII